MSNFGVLGEATTVSNWRLIPASKTVLENESYGFRSGCSGLAPSSKIDSPTDEPVDQSEPLQLLVLRRLRITTGVNHVGTAQCVNDEFIVFPVCAGALHMPHFTEYRKTSVVLKYSMG